MLYIVRGEGDATICCGVLCTFLFNSEKKSTKRKRRSRGRSASKLGKSIADFKFDVCNRAFCNPLPLNNPSPLLALGERWWGVFLIVCRLE